MVTTMKTYARIQGGVVVELLHSDQPASALFHPGLTWIDVSGQPNVVAGWTFDGTHFAKPPPVAAPAEAPTIPQILADLAVLKEEMVSLKARVAPPSAQS
jgi:hypothetical protein